MMFTSPLKKLRQSTWLNALPDTIDVPAIGGTLARNLPIERATLDHIAFPTIPGQDTILRYATKDGGHDGGVL